MSLNTILVMGDFNAKMNFLPILMRTAMIESWMLVNFFTPFFTPSMEEIGLIDKA